MTVVRFLSQSALLASIAIAGIACNRKLPIDAGGGSSNNKENSNKSVVVARNSPQVGKNKQSNDPPKKNAKPSANDVVVNPPKNVVPATPPDWSNVAKQEWAPNEKVILSAEEAQNYIPGTLRVSPDGGRFAYARKFADGEAMFVDGKELTRLASITPTLIEFSRDSKRLVYAGHNGLKSDEAGYVWGRDDKVSLISKVQGLGPFYKVEKFYTTPDASEVAYHVNGNYVVVKDKYVPDCNAYSVVFNTTEKLHHAVLLSGKVRVDDVTQKQFEAISGFQFSENGKNFGYIVTQSGEQFVVFGKSEERAYQKIDSLVLSPDGKRYAHRVEHEGKQYLVVDGKPKAYTGQFKRNVLFSPDSTRWATVLGNNVIVDHIADGEFASIDAASLAFSPDSKHYTYIADRGDREFKENVVVVLDGKVLGRYETIAKAPIFSADSQSLAYLAQSGGKWAVYVNGKKIAEVPFDPQGRWVLEFSPDSKSIGYAGSVDLVWHILLDGKLSEKNEPIGAEGTRIGFGPDGSFTYVVKRKNAYYFVSEKRK